MCWSGWNFCSKDFSVRGRDFKIFCGGKYLRNKICRAFPQDLIAFGFKRYSETAICRTNTDSNYREDFRLAKIRTTYSTLMGKK